MSLFACPSFDDLAVERELKSAYQELFDVARTIDSSPLAPAAGSVPVDPFDDPLEFQDHIDLMGFGNEETKVGYARLANVNQTLQSLGHSYPGNHGLESFSRTPSSTCVEHTTQAFRSAMPPRTRGSVYINPKLVEFAPQPLRSGDKTKNQPRLPGTATKSHNTPLPMESSTLVKQKAFSNPRGVAAQGSAHSSSALADDGRPSPKRSGASRKNRSTLKIKSPSPRFPCPEGCGQVCNSSGDLKRHLQSVAHKPPSVPCQNNCGKLFSRLDAARRHFYSCSL